MRVLIGCTTHVLEGDLVAASGSGGGAIICHPHPL
jgi:hypothetical protein